MEARLMHFVRNARVATFLGLSLFVLLHCQSNVEAQIIRGRLAAVRPHQAHSENFIVFASSPEWAQQVARAAEDYRRDLAIRWLGKELPGWPERCPIHVTAGPNLNASGETKFSPTQYGVGNWMMSVHGTPQRVLDSVLPHEISHTILATHFARYAHQNRYVPRWADEGACTTVEHEAEKRKHRHYLRQFLQTGRGLAFNQMFVLKDYPSDILPLYAQGHSAVQFLIDQSSPRAFVEFLEAGMETGRWESALNEHYDYETIGEFQTLWNKWLYDGSPVELSSYAPLLKQGNAESVPAMLASNATPAAPAMDQPIHEPSEDAFRNRQLKGKVHFAIRNTGPAPVQMASNESSSARSVSDSWYKRRFQEVSEGRGTSSEREMAIAASQTTPNSLAAESPVDTSRVLPPANDLSAWGDNVSTPASVPLNQSQELPSGGQFERERSGAWAEPPEHLTASSVVGTHTQSHSTAKQQGSESVQMHVLDWGNSVPRAAGSSMQSHSQFSSLPPQAAYPARETTRRAPTDRGNVVGSRMSAAAPQFSGNAHHASASPASPPMPAIRQSQSGSVRMVPIQR